METALPPTRDPFARFALATVGATLFLIGVGAFVRASGAGLGCPDWPKCFGMWIPPTTVDMLPPGYDRASFDVVNTWIEYVNRLVGVTVGFLILLTVVAAIRWHRHDRAIVISSVLAFLAVGFEGWLGAKVVALELKPVVVTIHLLGAYLVVGLLLFATSRALFLTPSGATPKDRAMTLGVFALFFVQMILGTVVRGVVETTSLSADPPARHEWLEHVPRVLDIGHRQLAVVVCIACVTLLVRLRKQKSERREQFAALVLVVSTAGQILAGLGLAYAGFPAALQVVHVVLSTLMFTSLFVLYLSQTTTTASVRSR